MVEFTNKQGFVRINPAEVVSLAESKSDDVYMTRIALTSGLYYDVPLTAEKVDEKLTASYTDVRYLAFVVEALCQHLKVEIVPPSQIKAEVIRPTSQPPEQES